MNGVHQSLLGAGWGHQVLGGATRRCRAQWDYQALLSAVELPGAAGRWVGPPVTAGCRHQALLGIGWATRCCWAQWGYQALGGATRRYGALGGATSRCGTLG